MPDNKIDRRSFIGGLLCGIFSSACTAPKVNGETRAELIAAIYVASTKDLTAEVDPEKMSILYNQFGPPGIATASVSISGNKHEFEVMMRGAEAGKYVLALYENGKAVGNARSEGSAMEAPEIYAGFSQNQPTRDASLTP